MKNKIVTAFMCAALGVLPIGCASPRSQFDSMIPSGEVVDRPVDTEQQPELSTENVHPPTVSIAPPDAPKNDDAPQSEPVRQKTDVLLCCTASSLKVRKGAGTSFAAVGALDRGDLVMPVRRAGDWYEVLFLGSSAYASAAYLKEVSFTKASDGVERVIDEGKMLLGMPYVYGAQRLHFGNGSLNANFDGKSYDCSSLMQYIFKLGAGVNLAMTSREQSLQGKAVSKADIRRGDLLFFTNASRRNKVGLERIGHVALYLGDNIILHTASDHAVIEPITPERNGYFITARRLLE